MQSQLTNLSEIIDNDISCENKDHRNRNPTEGSIYVESNKNDVLL